MVREGESRSPGSALFNSISSALYVYIRTYNCRLRIHNEDSNHEYVKPDMSCYTFVGLSTYAGGLMMALEYYTLPFLLTCVLYAVATVLYYVFFEKIEKKQKIADVSS